MIFTKCNFLYFNNLFKQFYHFLYLVIYYKNIDKLM